VVTASRGETVRVWDSVNGKRLVTLRRHAGRVKQASYSADGRRVVTASEDGTARVFDPDTDQQLLTLPGHTGEVLTARYGNDGTRIWTAAYHGRDRNAIRVLVYDPRPVNRAFLPAPDDAPPPRPVK
jgi:WD40 repeat protein